MAKFDYKKWVTENKHGKNLYEQGVADFQENAPADYISEQTGSGTGSATGSGTSSAAPICHFCDTGSGTPTVNSSTPAYYSSNWTFSNGYSWNSQGDCSAPFGIGNLNQSVVQASCQTTQTGSGNPTCYICDCNINPSSCTGTITSIPYNQLSYQHTLPNQWNYCGMHGGGMSYLSSNLVSAQNCAASASVATGSNMQECYGCENGQVVGSGTTLFNPQSSGWCGNMNGVDYYYPQTHSNLANCTTVAPCDVTPNGPCAQQWFGQWANNAINFMANKDCTGQYTFQGVKNQFLPQVTTLWQNRPNQNASFTPVASWNDIHALTIAGFGTGPSGQPQKGQFKRKLAKISWANCMSVECCGGNLNENLQENKKGCGCGKPKPPIKNLIKEQAQLLTEETPCQLSSKAELSLCYDAYWDNVTQIMGAGFQTCYDTMLANFNTCKKAER